MEAYQLKSLLYKIMITLYALFQLLRYHYNYYYSMLQLDGQNKLQGGAER